MHALSESLIGPVFHGTTAQFRQFRARVRPNEQVGFGISFTPDRSIASKYADDPLVRRGKGGEGRVVTAYLSIKRLLDLDALVYDGQAEFALAKSLAGKRLFVNHDEQGRAVATVGQAVAVTSNARAERMIRAAGYDGLRYTASLGQQPVRGIAPAHTRFCTYVVFDPAQIKIKESTVREQIEQFLAECQRESKQSTARGVVTGVNT